MNDSARILGLSSGDLSAKLMFIGEAPGRLGADATGIPFHGDKAGDNFEELLDFVGISRENVYITNAVLCNPKDENGNNASPNSDEITNCSKYLQYQIDLINPSLVVTLGANALKSSALIQAHDLTLKNNVRTIHKWYGRKLIPLYHPGQRAMIHRSFANQRSDYKFVADHLNKIGIPPRKQYGHTKETVAHATKILLNGIPELSYFSLHKILYLIEWAYLSTYGERLTGANFIRQKDGPYCTDLQITKLKNAIPSLQIRNKGSKIYISLPPMDLFAEQPCLDSALVNFIEDKLSNLKGASESELKTKAYLTKPMKHILRQEKHNSINFYNAPILANW